MHGVVASTYPALNCCPQGTDSQPSTEAETRLCQAWGEGCLSAASMSRDQNLQARLSTRAVRPCPSPVAPSIAIL